MANNGFQMLAARSFNAIRSIWRSKAALSYVFANRTAFWSAQV